MDRQPLDTRNRGEEISLYDLLRVFWKEKWLILLVTLLCVSIAIGYLYRVKPIYEAKAMIVAPISKDLIKLNAEIGRNYLSQYMLPQVTAENIYNFFIITLLSDSVKQDFFLQNDATLNLSLGANRLPVLVEEVPRSKILKYAVSIRSPESNQAIAWLKRYIAFANEKAVSEFVSGVNNENNNLASSIKQKIDQSIDLAKNERLNRISQLKEALNIANITGIQSQIKGYVARDYPTMMYERGSLALAAEIKVLSARKSDEPFADSLRKLINDHNFYSNIVVDPNAVKMFRFDGQIELYDTSTRTKMRLILMLSLMIGFVLGLMASLLRNGMLKSLLNNP